jgi:hypothetical protein
VIVTANGTSFLACHGRYGCFLAGIPTKTNKEIRALIIESRIGILHRQLNMVTVFLIFGSFNFSVKDLAKIILWFIQTQLRLYFGSVSGKF